MRSRVLWRRVATAAGIYGSAVFGFLGTVVSFRLLGSTDFALLAIALAGVGFLQVFLDLTVEEALVKFGFRYVAQERWGQLRRLFRVVFLVKGVGAVAGSLAVVVLALLSEPIFDHDELLVPMLVSALLPLVQAPETVAAAGLMVRERYDARALFQALSMLLRLCGLAAGSAFGVTEAVVGVVVAQVAASAAVGVAASRTLRRFPGAEPEPLGRDAGPIRGFVARSSVGTGLTSVRTWLGTLLLGAVSTTAQAGYFRIAQAPHVAFATLSGPARLVLLTEQTRDFERGRVDLVYRSLRRYIAWTAALMAVALVPLWALMPTLVRLVFGAEALPAVDPARLILVAAAVQLVWGWTKSFPVSIGRPGLRILAQAVEIAVLVPTLFVLGDRYGATGAAGAVLIATGAFAAVWALLLVRLRREAAAVGISTA